MLLTVVGLLAIAPPARTEPLPTPSQRVPAAPSRLVMLLQELPGDDRSERWDLANIALEVLLGTYSTALRASLAERPSTTDRQAKLLRWRRATGQLMADIDNARQRLLVGSDFAVFADAVGQMIVVVAGQPFAITGLGRDDDRLIEAAILERFCAFNHCPEPVTERESAALPALPTGRWRITQSRPPVFVIGEQLQCRFMSLAGRRAKAHACRMAAQEMHRLRSRLAALADLGQKIDWKLLTASRRESAGDLLLIVDDAGTYLKIALPTLAQLQEPDWVRVVAYLATVQQHRRLSPPVIDGDRLPVH